MPLVEPLRVDAVEPLHPFRQIEAASAQDEVEVPHQAERVYLPVVSHGATVEEREEHAAVIVVAEERDAACATRDDVEEAVRERGAKEAGDQPRVGDDRQEVSAVNKSASNRHTFVLSALGMARVRPWPCPAQTVDTSRGRLLADAGACGLRAAGGKHATVGHGLCHT